MSDYSRLIAELTPQQLELLQRKLRQVRKDKPASGPKGIPRRSPETDRSPLSNSQHRFWFQEQLMPGSGANHFPLAVRLRGDLNLQHLRESIHQIVRRHEILRTRFVLEGEEPVQIVEPWMRPAIPTIDLAGIEASRREEAFQRLARREGQRPFDLSRGPVLRAALVRHDCRHHVLLVNQHHIATDAWSTEILVSELALAYGSLSKGIAFPLPPLEVQYADFASWQQQRLSEQAVEAHLDFWVRQLEGTRVLEIPTDRPRPAVQTLRGDRLSHRFPLRTASGIKTLCQETGATLFMLLAAVFQVHLKAYTRQTDINIGTPVSNRKPPVLETLIGPFLNTLVIRGDLSGDPTFRGFLCDRFRETCLSAFAHQDVPFERIVQRIQPRRNSARTPLFQVMLALQNVPGESSAMESGLQLERVDFETGRAIFEVTLVFESRIDGISATLEYNRDLFDPSTMRRWLVHFEALLEQAVSEPDRRLSELHFLGAPERHQLLLEWNDSQRRLRRDLPIHALIEEQAARRPQSSALIIGEETWSYGLLNGRANQLARCLRRRGVGPDAIVGVHMRRSAEMILALLGILKAGGAYLPLDPSYPSDRLVFMIRDSGTSLLLTHESLTASFPSPGPEVVEVASLLEEMIEESEDPLPGAQADESNLVYVLYTSGSTGLPKAVMLPHRGICNLVQVWREVFSMGPQDRMLQFSSLSFDAATWEIFLALTSGASLILDSSEALLPGEGLHQLLRAYEISSLLMPPSALSMLPRRPLPALRNVLVGGEASWAELVDYWSAQCRFYNGYGPTEITVCSTLVRCQPGRGRPLIGRPLANSRMYLLDEALQPVGIGVPGEIFVAGAGLARGYLNRPDLTAATFLPDPFAQEPGARLYRTGDLARWRPDGNLDFLGRLDHQVKVRGFRIELGEIESVLRQHSSIEEVAIIARDDLPGGRGLVAYFLSAVDPPPSVADLRRWLRRKLPDHMVPALFVRLERFPLNRSGKLDRGRLPTPLPGRPDLEDNYVAPRTDIEKEVAEIWRQVLGVERVGIRDSFFDLGGHSLLATQVVSRLRRAYSVDLPVRDLFESPTVENVAESIEALRWKAQARSAIPQPNGEDREEFEI